ncbi:hypothetical protein V6N13_021585 [Hibiscus sabdariffa]|uniref:GST C-terminal domain-containing protein n=1 Tax=Hibiscus sabdariffa TaxID=183260 RepID=A0ABR2BA68_9ROSI
MPVIGRRFNPEAVAEGEKFLSASLSKIESFWLKDKGQFLLGENKPSIADLSLVCDIMQLEVLDEADRDRLLGPYKKVEQWIENTRSAANPHFDEVHKILLKVKEKRQNLMLKGANNEGGGSAMKKPLLSRI